MDLQFGIFPYQGGRHVDYVADQIVTKLVDVVKKKNKGGVAVKAHQVRYFNTVLS